MSQAFRTGRVVVSFSGTATAFGFVEPHDDRAAVLGDLDRLHDGAGAAAQEKRMRCRKRTRRRLQIADDERDVQAVGLVNHTAIAQIARVRQQRVGEIHAVRGPPEDPGKLGRGAD